MTHIDVRSALRDSTAGEYSDLVTRRTGAAVRAVIERWLDGLADGSVAFLDFSHIGLLDRSCADEFVAKLMLPRPDALPQRSGYVVLHGVSEWHLESIEAVLDTHGLALVVELPEAGTRLIGAVSELERRCWQVVMEQGLAEATHVARLVGMALEECHGILDRLAQRRLLRGDGLRFFPLGAAA